MGDLKVIKHASATKKQTNIKSWESQLSRLDGAYAEGTLRAYSADIRSFVSWCDQKNRKPFPATSKLVATFIMHEAERCSASTLKRRLAAIGKIHRLMKLENPVADEDVKLALRRELRKKATRPRQALGVGFRMIALTLDVWHCFPGGRFFVT